MDFLSGSEVPSSLTATSSTAPPPTSSDSTQLPGKKAIPIHQCDGIPEYCPGLQQRAYIVQDMLTRVAVVGIVGIGGIGKSTIAKQVFNNISSQFEYTAFVENAKDIPRPVYTMGGLHDEIPGKFYHNGIQVHKSRTRWYDFLQKKTLLVMDDVESESQLDSLPNLQMFGKGSHLIITSRKHSILKDFGKYPYEVYDVDLLGDHEAQKLFRRCAFGEKNEENAPFGSHHLEGYVERVVKKCQGLPLTLEITGCSLRSSSSEVRFWEETIEKLGKAEAIDGDPNEIVQASLQVSVDALPPEEREMLIDAGTFFYQQPLDEAMAAWSTAYQNSNTAWENLLKRSLVKKVGMEEWVYEQLTQVKKVTMGVWVHEQLRDLAKNLANSEVVCLSDGDADKAVGILNTGILNTKTVNTETHSLRLSYNYVYNGGCVIKGPPETVKYLMGMENDFVEEGKRPLQVQSLERLEQLKYMELKNIPCKGTTKNFPNKLSLLSWNLNNRQLPQINLEGLNNLAVLILHGATVPNGFLQPLGYLIKLRILSLRGLNGLDCLPENFGNLSGLKRLDLEGLYKLSRLPSSFGNLSALEDLNLERLGIGELPESFGDLSSLATLSIERCGRLASLPSSFGRLSLLKKLAIDPCEGLKDLGDSFGNLSALTDLRLYCCTSLERLPASFGNLSALENLELNYCSTLKSLPNNFGRLGALKRLTITDAHQLEQLPDSFGNLPALTYLKLKACLRLERLPESFGLLIALKILELENSDYDHMKCSRLQTLPDNFGQLKALERLTIKEAANLESLPDNFGDLSALTYLRLEGCPKLERFPDSFGRRSPLKELYLKSCAKLPDNIFLPVSLQTLEIIECGNLQRLPENLGENASLRRLKIQCNGLQMLPENFGKLSSLEVLDIKSIELKSLPESLGWLPALRELSIEVKILRTLPGNLGNLSCLEKLKIENCAELKSLPELGNMSSLKVLEISGCKNLETLPDSLGSISSLKNVTLLYCPRLKTLPDGLGRPFFPQLTPPLQADKSMEHGKLAERLFSITKRQKGDPPAQIASTEGVRIQVYCPLLNDSVLERLGWVVDPDYKPDSWTPNSFSRFNWYQRKRVDESNCTTI